VADLQVDYTELTNLQVSLARVADGLENIRAESDVIGADWGGRAVRDAMHGFVSNWGAHREKVTRAVRELSDDCRGSVLTFQGVEQHLTGAPASGPAD